MEPLVGEIVLAVEIDGAPTHYGAVLHGREEFPPASASSVVADGAAEPAVLDAPSTFTHAIALLERTVLTQMAHAAAHTKGTYLSRLYHRLAARRGKKRTIRSGKRLDRTQAFVILRRIARQANAHLPNEKGVHHAMELSSHRSDRYIWRYVKPDEQSLAEALNDFD